MQALPLPRKWGYPPRRDHSASCSSLTHCRRKPYREHPALGGSSRRGHRDAGGNDRCAASCWAVTSSHVPAPLSGDALASDPGAGAAQDVGGTTLLHHQGQPALAAVGAVPALLPVRGTVGQFPCPHALAVGTRGRVLG